MLRVTVIENSIMMFFFTCLTAVVVNLADGKKLSPASQNEPFVVQIVGYDQELQYAVKYGVVPSGSAPTLLSTVKQQANTEFDVPAVLGRELRRRREARREAVKKFNLPSLKGAKWVNPSPNGKYLFVGFEDPSRDVMRHAAVLKASDLAMIREFTLTGSRYIVDSEWSADSQFLAVLETSERYSLAPRDLILLLLSHPVPLNTFSVNFMHVGSGVVTKTFVVKDVPYATAIISRAGDKIGLETKPYTPK